MRRVDSWCRSVACVVGLSVAVGWAGAARAAPLFSDAFARTTGLGSSWRVWFGGFATDGTFAVSGPATPADAGNWASVVPALGTSDYAVQADLVVPSGSLYSGLFARSTNVPDVLGGDLYAAQLSTAGTVNLYKRHAGAWTVLGSVAAGIQAETRYTLRLVTTGSTAVHLEVWLNGSRLIAADDASGIPGGTPGIESFDGNVRYASFAVWSAGAGTPPGGGGGSTTGQPAGTIDVRSYGAVGDGIADDTAAFRSAAATGQPIWVPAAQPGGFYRITGFIALQSSIYGDASRPEIRMDGADGDPDQGHTHNVFWIDGYVGTGLVIDRLTLNGGWAGGTNGEWSHLVNVAHASNVTVQRSWLRNAYGDAVFIGVLANANDGRPLPDNIVISGNRLENPRRCNVGVDGGTNIQIRGNDVVKPTSYVAAIDLEPDPNGFGYDRGIVIDGNVFEVAAQDFGAGAVSMNNPAGNPWSGDVSITNNSGSWSDVFAYMDVPGSGHLAGMVPSGGGVARQQWLNVTASNDVKSVPSWSFPP
jgi:hypothetical protein